MTTITIAYEVSEEKIAEIQKHLDYLSATHGDFAADPLNIERGDFTEIDGELISHYALASTISNIILEF